MRLEHFDKPLRARECSENDKNISKHRGLLETVPLAKPGAM
jgi:hypothetical protein